MSDATIVGVISVLLFIFVWVFVALFKKERYPYRKREFLMSVPERKFYRVLLQQIDGKKYDIFPQVPLSRIVEVTEKGKNFWKYHNKINKKIVDFVVFKKPHYEPVLVIEYDDSSHNKKERRKRDEFVNRVLKKANLPIIHVKYGEKINLKFLK